MLYKLKILHLEQALPNFEDAVPFYVKKNVVPINTSLYTLAFSPSLGGSQQNTRTHTMGVLLRSSSNYEGPGRVWIALLEQHSFPRLPQLTSLYRCHLPYCLCHRVASIRQPRGNSRCQSELRHNHSPLIPIPSTLTCLPHIHPPIIQGSLLHPFTQT